MSYPSIKTIETRLGVDRSKARKIHRLMDGSVNPDHYPSVDAWIRQCCNSPRKIERIMLAINEEMGGFGVEAIQAQNVHQSFWMDTVLTYVNMGETYTDTVCWSTLSDRFEITSYGNWIENHPSLEFS